MKKIDVTIGYRIEDDNANIVYFPGASNEGFVYKDDNAFKEHKGVAYIPEFAFNPEKGFATEEDACYTYQDFRNLAETGYKECKDYSKIKNKESFLESMANAIYSSSEWCSPETLIDDWDFDEDVTDWIANNE